MGPLCGIASRQRFCNRRLANPVLKINTFTQSGVLERHKVMTKITFEDDPSSRKMLRFLLLLEIVAMAIVVGSIAFHLYSFALAISFMTFIVFIAILLWLYLRYRSTPVVREKHDLEQQILHLQNSIRAESNNILFAKQKRDGFFKAEQTEIDTTLLNLQQNYIQKGLASSYIKDATIPGVGPKLKERLVTYHIYSADHISDKISEIPGFGDAKCQALVGWRTLVYTQLESTKPVELSNEQLESIKQIHEAFHNENDANEKKARNNKQNLENNLNSLQPRLEQLSPITFGAYLSKSLASRGTIARVYDIMCKRWTNVRRVRMEKT